MQYFSYSKVTTFRNCPKSYEFRYVLREPERFSTIERHMGTVVHEALRWAYAEREEGRDPEPAAVVDRYDTEWFSAGLSDAIVVKPGLRSDDYRLDGRAMVENYAGEIFPRDRSETLGLEQRFQFDLTGDLRFTGIIDRIAREPGGCLRLTDYKTGSRVPNPLSDPQLAYYAAYVFETFPDDAIELAYVDLRNGKDLCAQFHRDAIIPHLNKLIEQIALIGATEEFEPVPSALCKWCGYSPICDGADPAARDVARRIEGSSDAHSAGRQCPECGSALVPRNGRFGPFLGCKSFPRCRYTRNPD